MAYKAQVKSVISSPEIKSLLDQCINPSNDPETVEIAKWVNHVFTKHC